MKQRNHRDIVTMICD